jgi:hypothetical protein
VALPHESLKEFCLYCFSPYPFVKSKFDGIKSGRVNQTGCGDHKKLLDLEILSIQNQLDKIQSPYIIEFLERKTNMHL